MNVSYRSVSLLPVEKAQRLNILSVQAPRVNMQGITTNACKGLYAVIVGLFKVIILGLMGAVLTQDSVLSGMLWDTAIILGQRKYPILSPWKTAMWKT
jgi:hypothetical protein